MTHRIGNSYLVEFYTFMHPFLYAPSPGVSLMEPDAETSPIFEVLLNGEPLPGGPSTIAQTIEKGGGRYSYSDSFVLFSLPGNRLIHDTDVFVARFPVHVSWGFLTAILCALFLVACLSVGKKPFGGIGRLRSLLWCCFGVGLALLALNVLGSFLPLRHPDLAREPHSFFGEKDITLGLNEAMERLQRSDGETDIQFALRSMAAVNQAMAHYWWEKGAGKYRITVPAWENYLLFAMALFDPSYRFYSFSDPEKALQRGLGHCGQQAQALLGVLKDNGVPACLASLGGHTVVSVRAQPGVWHILDPDFGVHVPHSLEELENDTAKILPYYEKAKLYQIPRMPREGMLLVIQGWYGPENNVTACPGGQNWDFWDKKEAFERLCYQLKWIIPMLLMLPLFLYGLGAMASGRRKR